MHLSLEQLNAGLPEILESPKDHGALEAIVIRPKSDQRVSLDKCDLSPEGGVHGDNWAGGCWMSLPDGSPHPDVQVTLMNSRTADLVAREKNRWPLAGDQLFANLDLSHDNLQPGRQLAIGSAILEITEVVHSGCRKFSERFGVDALKFVNSEQGKHHRLRGIYAKIVGAGVVSVGDEIRKL